LVGIVENLLMLGEEMIVMWANYNLLLPLTSTGFYPDGNSPGTPWKIAENRTPKWGSSPRAEIHTSKWFILNHLRSKMFGQIQNLDPHRLMSRLKSKTTPADTLRTRPYPIDVWIQKMDISGSFTPPTNSPLPDSRLSC